MELRELTNQEFYNFTSVFQPFSVYQTLEYAFLMNRENFDSMLVGLISDNNELVAASLILVEKFSHFKYAYAPRGFLIDYNNFNLLQTFTDYLKKFLGKKSIMAIKLCPLIIQNVYDFKYNTEKKNGYYEIVFQNLKKLDYKHLGYHPFFDNLKPRFEAVVNLDLPYYMLFHNMRKQTRTKVRGAERNGVKIYKGSKADLSYLSKQTSSKYPRGLDYFEQCYEIFARNNQVEFFYAKLDTKQYLTETQAAYARQEATIGSLNEEIMSASPSRKKKLINQKIEADKYVNQYKNQLITATGYLRDYPEGILLASALIVKVRNQVYLFMDGFDMNYASLNGKHLLLWKLIERYSQLGYKTLNLGGMTDFKAENNPYLGLNHFKLGFHPQVIEYMGDLELVTNNALYFMYQNAGPMKSILKR